MNAAPVSFYQAQLLGAWLHAQLLDAGIPSAKAAVSVSTHRHTPGFTLDDFEWFTQTTISAHVSYGVPARDGKFYPDDEDREEFANQWLIAHPETRVIREEGSIYLFGLDNLGLSWKVNVGQGTCERVQVGTRTVTKIDPDYLVGAPMIQVDEPVFEIVCADPINLAKAVAA
jgi:hypothetical protein